MIRLGDIEFTGFALPEKLGGGGEQALAVHKMIGGKRRISAMGPDDAPLTWTGRFLDEFAELRVFQLDLLRRSGRQVQLTFATRAYLVVVRSFTFELVRPQLYTYSISCEVVEDQVAGDGGKESRTMEAEIAADIAAAEAYAASRDQILYAIGLASTAIRAAMGDKTALRGLGNVVLAEAQGAVGNAVFEATGQASAANLAVAAVGGVGGVVAGGDPKTMALNFLSTTAATELASNAGLASAHMSGVQANIGQVSA